MTRVTVFVIAAVLAVAATACGDSHTYELSIASTVGGCVTAPGEGAFTCDAGTVVELLATPDAGYEFQAWTGDIQDIADPDSRATTITMNGNYLIMANFGQTGPPGPGVP